MSAPFIGHFLDNYGARTKVMIVACGTCVIGMLLFIFMHPVVPSLLLGIAYSLGAASIFPCIAYIVPKEKLGKSNGVVLSLQNLGCSIFPYFVAFIKVAYGSYDYATGFLAFTAGVSIFFAWKTYEINVKKGYNLEKEVMLMEVKNFELLELNPKETSDDNFDF